MVKVALIVGAAVLLYLWRRRWIGYYSKEVEIKVREVMKQRYLYKREKNQDHLKDEQEIKLYTKFDEPFLNKDIIWF